MSAPIHIVVRGTPVSFQTKGRALRAWKEKVAAAARERVTKPIDDDELAVTITYYYRRPPRFDTDNMSKPICDALNSIVYYDDRQISDRTAKRVPIGRAFVLFGMPRELGLALLEGSDFVFITVRRANPQRAARMRALFGPLRPAS